MIAVMAHGRSLFSLVTEAMAGNDDAFVRAVHADRLILKHVPYFVERVDRAYREGDVNFLETLGRWQSKPQLIGRIQYPLLYLLFAFLDSFNMLDGSLTDAELLDLCDAAGLDRQQNRIEDTNYLTKRRLEYLRFKTHNRRQKSMS